MLRSRAVLETGACSYMKLQAGIKLLSEIEGYDNPICDSDSFDAVLKFYRNKGDPLEFETVLQEPVPYIDDSTGVSRIAWNAPKMHKSNIVFERYRMLARQADMLPGIYYAILGMKTMGYRKVAIPPHLYAHSMYQVHGIDRESIIRLEIFLLKIHPNQPDKTLLSTAAPK